MPTYSPNGLEVFFFHDEGRGVEGGIGGWCLKNYLIEVRHFCLGEKKSHTNLGDLKILDFMLYCYSEYYFEVLFR